MHIIKENKQMSLHYKIIIYSCYRNIFYTEIDNFSQDIDAL